MSGDPDVIGTHVDRLWHRHGVLTPEMMLEDARRQRSPLHDQFNWDDEDAAERYRLAQARKVIRSLVVRYEDGSEAPITVRAFVKIAHDHSHNYGPIHFAMSNEQIQNEVLHQALFELDAFMQKYRTLNELAVVFEAIGGVQQQHARRNSLDYRRHPGDKWAGGGAP